MKSNLNPKITGNVKVEKIRDGEVIEEFENHNLVLDSAYDILVRSLSGDPAEQLWKYPKLKNPKHHSGTNGTTPEEKDIEWKYGFRPKFIYSPQHGYEEGYWPLEYDNTTWKTHNAHYDDVVDESLYLPQKLSTTGPSFIGMALDNEHYVNNDSLMIKPSGSYDILSGDYFGGIAFKSTDSDFALEFHVNEELDDVSMLFNADLLNHNAEANVLIDGVEQNDLLKRTRKTINEESTSSTVSLTNMGDDQTFEFPHTNIQEDSLVLYKDGVEDTSTLMSQVIDSDTDLTKDGNAVIKFSVKHSSGISAEYDYLEVEDTPGEYTDASVIKNESLMENITYEYKVNDFKNKVNEGSIVRVEYSDTNTNEEPLVFSGLFLTGLNQFINTVPSEVPTAVDQVEEYETYKNGNRQYVFTIDTKGESLDKESVKVISGDTGTELINATGKYSNPAVSLKPTEFHVTDSDDVSDFDYVDAEDQIVIGRESLSSEGIYSIQVSYKLQGDFDTDYRRAVIKKPKDGRDYPFYDFRTNKVTFEAVFEEHNPNYPVVIKELFLCTKPLLDNLETEDIDNYKFNNELFSIYQIDGVRKDPNDRLRIIWEIKFK